MKKILLLYFFLVSTSLALDFSIPKPAIPGQPAEATDVNQNWQKPLNILKSYDGQFIKDNSITGIKLQNASIDGNKISLNTVTSNNLNYPLIHLGSVNFLTGDINGTEILDGTINSIDLNNEAVEGQDLNETSVVNALVDKDRVIYYFDSKFNNNGDTIGFFVYDDGNIDSKILIIEIVSVSFSASWAGQNSNLTAYVSDGFDTVTSTIIFGIGSTISSSGSSGYYPRLNGGLNLGSGSESNFLSYKIDISSLSGKCQLSFLLSPIATIFSFDITINSMKKINIYNNQYTGE